MTPKQKANKLCEDMLQWSGTAKGEHINKWEFAKQCALIAVRELMNESSFPAFWIEVQEEILNKK
jgi:hypothetical protein